MLLQVRQEGLKREAFTQLPFSLNTNSCLLFFKEPKQIVWIFVLFVQLIKSSIRIVMVVKRSQWTLVGKFIIRLTMTRWLYALLLFLPMMFTPKIFFFNIYFILIINKPRKFNGKIILLKVEIHHQKLYYLIFFLFNRFYYYYRY